MLQGRPFATRIRKTPKRFPLKRKRAFDAAHEQRGFGVHFQDKIQNFPSAFEILQERVHAREFEVRRRIK